MPEIENPGISEEDRKRSDELIKKLFPPDELAKRQQEIEELTKKV